MDHVGSKRRGGGVKTSVVAGSVWESRMRLDQVKGGIKVFNGGDEKNPEQNNGGDGERRLVKRNPIASVGVSGKRKTWKSESSDAPIQIAGGEKLSVSMDGIRKSSVQGKKGRSEGTKEVMSVSVDGLPRSPIPKGRSKPRSEIGESGGQLRRAKSDSVKSNGGNDGNEGNSVQLRKEKSEPEPEKCEEDESVDGIEKNPPEIEEGGFEETCKEVISSNEKLSVDDCSYDDDEDDDFDDQDNVVVNDEEEDEETDQEIELKEINIPEDEKSKNVEAKVTEEIPKRVEILIPEQKPKKVEAKVTEEIPKRVEILIPEQKPKKVVIEEKKVHQFRNKAAPPTSSSLNKQPPPVIRRATIYQNLAKPTPASVSVASEYQSFPQTHNKLQNLVDLVMWRDISRSAFVFGIGTFTIISSSYTKDLNVSFISVSSYLGLVYLAAIFLYRSLICRGVIAIDDDDDDKSCVLGEGEAIWLLKLVLPYLNEFLLKIRALFSGDPSTTMKMAVLLFVFARCGNSITIWKMAKLGFFGVFIVPKVCSSYSTQLTGYGKFWVRRFRDAWESCSHKKAVALAIFTLVWNLSSMVARIWAVFMMFVAVRYYQQTMEKEDWAEEEEEDDEEEIQQQRQTRTHHPISVELNSKLKKGF